MTFARVQDGEVCSPAGLKEGGDPGHEGCEACGCAWAEGGEVAAAGKEVVLHVNY